MKREEMKQAINTILLEVQKVGISVEDASEKVVKVFEKSLEDSISEAVAKIPGLGSLLKGVKK